MGTKRSTKTHFHVALGCSLSLNCTINVKTDQWQARTVFLWTLACQVCTWYLMGVGTFFRSRYQMQSNDFGDWIYVAAPSVWRLSLTSTYRCRKPQLSLSTQGIGRRQMQTIIVITARDWSAVSVTIPVPLPSLITKDVIVIVVFTEARDLCS